MIGVFRKPWIHYLPRRVNALPASGGSTSPPTFPAADDLAEGTGTRAHGAVSTSAGDWLVVEVEIEAGTTNVFQPSCPTLSFTKQNDTGTGAGDSQVVQWTSPDAAGGSRTVTITPGGGSTLNYRSRVTVVRGSDGPGTGKAVSANAQTASITRQGNNSAIFMAVCDFNVGAPGSQTWTPGGSTKAVQQGSAATYVYGRWDDSGAAGTASHGLSAPSFTGPSVAVLEMLGTAAGAATAVPFAPARLPTLRDTGEAPWLQRDRRNAHLVATAADPLVTPLDSAWQADGQYWHLYGDAADAATRTIQAQQRTYPDPTLLTPAATAVPFAPARQAQPRDTGEVPWVQRRSTDPQLLASAELENELLGGADTARHAAVYTDRREAPQQRTVFDPSLLTPSAIPDIPTASPLAGATYAARATRPQQRPVFDPTLLATAQLENELLGAGDTTRHTAAAYYDRRQVPQQPPRESDPNLLNSALLENELLGGAETGKRTNVPATHADRREVPQQRKAFADTATPSVPYDLSVNPGWQAYLTAALHVERREVPQQRLYLSDPSFYPTVAPTDPLTLAWGAGGTYWGLYNTAALQVSRREVPQQRSYISDPALLLSAQLDELLGSGDTARHAMWFTDRRVTVQARPVDANLITQLDSPLLGQRQAGLAAYTDRRATVLQRPSFDPSLLSPASLDPFVDWRRTTTYTDRRQTAVQPPRRTLYFDAGPGSPPLTLAWGAGGDLWHRYNPRRPARIWWPATPVHAVLDHSCDTPRPDTGITARPSTGMTGYALASTARPDTGITARPDTGITEDPC